MITAKECSKCHETKSRDEFGPHKRTKSGLRSWCRKCESEDQRRRWRENPEYAERHKARNALYLPKWRKENPEKMAEYGRKWREENPEKHKAVSKASQKKWRANNRGHVAFLERKRQKGLKEGSDEGFSDILRNDPCAYCGEPATTADHMEALSIGGPHDWENLTAACVSCNSSKYKTGMLFYMLERS